MICRNEPHHRRLKTIEALNLFPSLSTRGVTLYLMGKYPELFNNYSTTRTLIQILRGLKKQPKDTSAHRHKDVPEYLPEIPKSRHIIRTPFILPYGVWGIMSDLHVPFHEKKPIETTLNYFKREKITGLILNGDFLDCEAVGLWLPTTRPNFSAEIEAGCKMLDFLRKELPKVKIIYRLGNHEDRLDTYCRMHAPELIGVPGAMADLETYLSTELRDITVLERKQKIIANELTILHGHEIRQVFASVSPARGLSLKCGACVAAGHWHITTEHTETNINRKMQTCWSVGCMCDLEPDYCAVGNRWNWGCAILNHEKRGNWEFINRRILENGKLV